MNGKREPKERRRWFPPFAAEGELARRVILALDKQNWPSGRRWSCVDGHCEEHGLGGFVAVCLLMVRRNYGNAYVVGWQHERDDGGKSGCDVGAHGDRGGGRRYVQRLVTSATRRGYAHILHHDGHDRGCSPAAGAKNRETQEEPQASTNAKMVVALESCMLHSLLDPALSLLTRQPTRMDGCR